MTGDSRLELKSEIAVSGIVLSSCMKKYISSIEISEGSEKHEKSCALTIYFCEKGESLWNIARRYNTTVEAIIQENEGISETVDENRMMLIPGA